ncbi:MAG: beta-lactamase family protein [Gemmatimonadaceae bacterium]|nr:beta-lactamase family protein [Gemmatimonadaceae bacterium]
MSAIVTAALHDQQAPGASLVVMKGDEIVLARGYGLETVERTDAVAPTTVFLLNSMSKQFTAALILKLAEEGKVTLDDPAARYLPDFTRLPPGLKIRHLLTHTSGMREIVAQPELNAVMEKPGTSAEEFVALARNAPSDFAPGSRWSYANMNYLMLTLIAERVTGQPLEDALRARFFGPLGLSSMRECPPHPGGQRGEARGHTRSAGVFVPHPPENFHLFSGFGGYCGNAVDLARWARALATGRILSAESYAQMVAPATLNDGRTADYGMAMALVSPDGARRLGHGGYGGGFSSQFAYYPEAEMTVVVMLNRWVFPEYMERRISRRLLGVPDATLHEAPLSADQRLGYAGSYDIGIPGSYAKVVEREGKLWFEFGPLRPQPLTYVGNDEFVREGEPYGYRLYFGHDGTAREVRILGMGLMSWYGLRQQ